MFYSSNEAPERTDCNAKNIKSLRCTVAEKIKKNPRKGVIFQQKYHFWWFFLIFSATVHRKELRFFALQSVRPGASFGLSNNPIQYYFLLAYNDFLQILDPWYGGKKYIFRFSI